MSPSKITYHFYQPSNKDQVSALCGAEGHIRQGPYQSNSPNTPILDIKKSESRPQDLEYTVLSGASEIYSERSLVLKSVTERNSMSCEQTYYRIFNNEHYGFYTTRIYLT